jgi:hypothetical protein
MPNHLFSHFWLRRTKAFPLEVSVPLKAGMWSLLTSSVFCSLTSRTSYAVNDQHDVLDLLPRKLGKAAIYMNGFKQLSASRLIASQTPSPQP